MSKMSSLLEIFIYIPISSSSCHLEIDPKWVNMNPIDSLKPFPCRYCSKRYNRRYNLQRHEECAHAAYESDMRDIDDRKVVAFGSGDSYVDYYEPEYKRRRSLNSETESNITELTIEDDDSEESVEELEPEEESAVSSEKDESSSELEDNVTYQDWLEEAREATEEMRNVKTEKYIDEGMDEDQAKDKANRKTLWAVKKVFFNNYKNFLLYSFFLEDNKTHEDIVEDLKEKVDKGMRPSKAIDRVMPKHHAEFIGLFNLDEAEDNRRDSDD